MDRFGVEVVEDFIDTCLSVDDLIDIHSPFVKRAPERVPYEFPRHTDDDEEVPLPTRFATKAYLDAYVNPPDVLAEEVARRRKANAEKMGQFPEEPARDVMLFLLESAPLKSWQADVLAIIRDEAYYFAPQGQTKIMNEGWATYWHSTIMTRHGIEPHDLICYADHCSGTLASSPTRLNPYKLGVELFRDIEDRWNKGRFGDAYAECEDMSARHNWDTQVGRGRQKIFEVRRTHNDLTFVDEFLTLDFCRAHKLFAFGYNEDSGYYEIESREFPKIKQRLMFQLTNLGRPIIYVRDGNYRNRGELYLEHRYNGHELKMSFASDTLVNLQKIWRRPVHVETVLDGHVATLSFDGSEHRVEKTDVLWEEA
jgi:stage V sporulation protein R